MMDDLQMSSVGSMYQASITFSVKVDLPRPPWPESDTYYQMPYGSYFLILREPSEQFYAYLCLLIGYGRVKITPHQLSQCCHFISMPDNDDE